MIDSTNITMEQAQVIHNECQRNFEENESLIGSLERVLESVNTPQATSCTKKTLIFATFSDKRINQTSISYGQKIEEGYDD